MAAKTLSGREISAEVRQELKEKVTKLKSKGLTPGLVMVRVGEDPASVSYVKQKGKTTEELGIYSETVVFPEETSEEKLLTTIAELNNDPRFHGILVQLPLPRHISQDRVINAIDPMKDADCFHPVNVGRLLIGDPYLLPCTPHGVQQILIRSGYSPEGKHVVICGRSNLNGKPLFAILVQKRSGANATVTVCHTGTKNLPEITRSADILVAAMGSPKFIKANMVKEGAVVFDVGISQKDGKVVGDVDFEAVLPKVLLITPVPGGVGPMTISILLQHTLESAHRISG